MSFNSWLQNLKSTCGLGSGSRTPRRRLQVEALEDRTVPATFTVLNTLDSGAGSFRDAITQVNADPQPGIDTINFAIGSGVQTIAPLSAWPVLLHPVVKKYLLTSPELVVWTLGIGGVVLILFEWLHGEKPGAQEGMGSMPLWKAFLVGACQVIAMVPGVSRSAARLDCSATSAK